MEKKILSQPRSKGKYSNSPEVCEKHTKTVCETQSSVLLDQERIP